MKFFIGCLLFVYEFISFSRGKLMALHRYFKKKVVLTDPNGNVSSTIHPMVIASMHRERAAGEVEARLPGQLLQVQVLHLTILTDKYDTHGYSCSFPNPPFLTDLFIDVHVP